MSLHGMGRNFALLEQYYEKRLVHLVIFMKIKVSNKSLSYFFRLLNIVNELGKKVVIWQEVIDNKVKVCNHSLAPTKLRPILQVSVPLAVGEFWINKFVYGN